MKNVLLIINPVSGQKRIQPKLFDIVQCLCKADCNVTVKITQYRAHATVLAENSKNEGFDTIICCGGDGTLNETITGLLKADIANDIMLGYIPCGSTNDFADTLGLNSEPEKEIENIIKGECDPLDIGYFNSKKYFSYIASFGALTDASYSAPQDLKNTFGHFAYILEGLKDLPNIKPIEAKITADGKEFSGKYIFGSVSNTKSVAGLVKLKDDIVDLKDGLFELLLVKFPGNIIDLNTILLGATQSNFKSDMFTFIKAKEVTFNFEENITWSLDGEKAEAGKQVNIKALEKAVTLYL